MKGKKVLEFLILKPAFTSRNLSSLGLVALFFLVYWLAGGKVTVPSVKQGSNFGSVSPSDKLNQNGGANTPSAIPALRNNAGSTSSFGTNSEAAISETDKTKELEEKLHKLNELEERLKSLKRAKSGGD